MSTSTIFDDNFASYTPGSDNIAGFYDSGFFKGQVVSFSGGFEGRTGQGYQFNGAGGFLQHDETSPQDSTQIVYAMWAGVGFANVLGPPLIQLNNVDFSTGTGSLAGHSTPICGIGVNPDYTLYVWITSTQTAPLAGRVAIATSVTQAFYYQTWQYYQANFTTFPFAIGTNTYVGVTGTLAVDGTMLCSGTGVTGVLVPSLYTLGANFNEWQFASARGGIMTDITGIVGAPLPPFSTWPHPGTPAGRVTQAVVELAKAPPTREARITQGGVEVIKAPPNREARVTQGVVEVILRRTAGGWVCYEA